MDQAKHSKMVSFIWGIAADVLRDLFKRGKYPDVILPMCVLRRLDAVLEPTKELVLEMKKTLDKARIADQRDALCEAALEELGERLSASELRLLYKATSWRDEAAPPVIAKLHKAGKAKADPIHGIFSAKIEGENALVEYEADSELRDTEQVPLVEEIAAFIRREVLPYAPDAWVDESKTKIGYEITFTRHFYKPQPLGSVTKIVCKLAIYRSNGRLVSHRDAVEYFV